MPEQKDENTVITIVSAGNFEAENCTYTVQSLTDEISKITKDNSSNFCLIGKVLLEETVKGKKLLIYTGKTAAFMINGVKPLYIAKQEKANMINFENINQLIEDAEKISCNSIVTTEQKNNELALKSKQPINKATFIGEDGLGIQVHYNADKSSTTIDVMEANIIYGKTTHHEMKDSFIIEYEDGTRNVVGIDEKGRPVYISPQIKKSIEFIPRLNSNKGKVEELEI